MVNIKKIIIFILVIISVITGVFFYWKNEQKELIGLNQSLPEGIRITKTLIGRYEINNRIDDYKFKAPKSWEGINYIEYLPETTEKNHTFSTINIEGKTKRYKTIGISKFSDNLSTTLLEQITSIFNDFELNHNFSKKKIKNREIIKDDLGLQGIYAYSFQKKEEGNIFILTGASEVFIEEIIIDGTW